MSSPISTLSIEQFRSLRSLKLSGLRRVNLITGKNNTGKSSVLEALRILASDASPTVLSRIVRDREEDIGGETDSESSAENDDLSQIAGLFTGFPAILQTREPIILAGNGGSRSMRLTISVGIFTEQLDTDGRWRLVPAADDLFPDAALVPAMVLDSGSAKRVVRLDFLRRPLRANLVRGEQAEEAHVPCVFVTPYGGERTANLGPLWDKIALSPKESEVVTALKIIAPEIDAVSMVGGGGPQRMRRTAIVRSKNFLRPVPLRSFGDGLNRLFGIILSLVNAQGGLLLIDEFENGLHHTVQHEVWKGIFRLSSLMDVQVFATSHSWDAVQAFQKAAAENSEQGVLIRLTRKGDLTIPTYFKEDELAVAGRESIDVR